jgi:SAM-dependent methyltransferase
LRPAIGQREAIRMIYGNAYDVSDKAEFYASAPHGHHKHVVYPLFIDILAALAARRVLDIGAGPGHLPVEFSKRRPDSPCAFTLLDSSKRLLAIARERLAGRAAFVEADFGSDGWSGALGGGFDAIVSNNALFHLHPDRLPAFYRDCHRLLGEHGILLSQLSFAYAAGRDPYGAGDGVEALMRALPQSIMPAMPPLSESERADLERRKAETNPRHLSEIAEAQRATKAPGLWMHYHFLTVEDHLAHLRAAGFSAGCIWRQREFAVLLGVKGRPVVAGA